MPFRAPPPQDGVSTNFTTWASALRFRRRGTEIVTPLGLEPRTLSLKVRCSNQLSYGVFPSPSAKALAKRERKDRGPNETAQGMETRPQERTVRTGDGLGLDSRHAHPPPE